MTEKRAHTFQTGASDLCVIQQQFIIPQRFIKGYFRAREQAIQIQRDRTADGDTQSIITVAPVFNECNIWRTLGGGCL